MFSKVNKKKVKEEKLLRALKLRTLWRSHEQYFYDYRTKDMLNKLVDFFTDDVNATTLLVQQSINYDDLVSIIHQYEKVNSIKPFTISNIIKNVKMPRKFPTQVKTFKTVKSLFTDTKNLSQLELFILNESLELALKDLGIELPKENNEKGLSS